MAGSPKKRARRDRAAGVADPLDETYVAPRPALAPIPWNKQRLTEEQRALVRAAVLAHYPRNEIARALGTTVKTLKRILDDEPELTDAVDAAREAEEAELRDCLMRNAKSGSDVAALFLLKTRHGYRDRDDGKVPLTAGGGVLVVPAAVPLDEWTAAAARQQAKYREKPTELVKDEAERAARAERDNTPRTGSPGIEGLRLVRPGR